MMDAGLYYRETEITPRVAGVVRVDGSGTSVARFEPHTEVRAVIEGQVGSCMLWSSSIIFQILAKRVHAERLGYNLGMNSAPAHNSSISCSLGEACAGNGRRVEQHGNPAGAPCMHPCYAQRP